MIKNADGTYIYLVVPAKYECIYTKLLVSMSDLGIDLIKDCSATCRGINRQVLNCWNMFQGACCAYEMGEEKKADLMINYINAQLKYKCGEIDPERIPTITNFKLNVRDVIGNQTITINRAEFTLTNPDLVQDNSLKVIYLNDNTVIAEGLSINSPVDITPLNLDVKVGSTYSWKLVVTGTDGKEYSSNTYSITCKTLPITKVNVMYYGNTNTAPIDFQSMNIDAIFALAGITPKDITGESNNTFVIHQTAKVHYLLIPEDKMDLIKAEYGTVLITTLWDNTDPTKSAYFTTNPGGVHDGVKYKVFFSYSPMGAFDEDIRITCKNK